MKKLIFIIIAVSLFSFLNSSIINFTDNWNKEGLNLISSSGTELIFEYSVFQIPSLFRSHLTFKAELTFSLS